MKKKSFYICLVLLSGIFLLTAGCMGTKTYQIYEGEPRPADQVAKLKVPVYIDVLSIDGEKVGPGITLLRGNELDLDLLPGPHTIRVRYDDVWEVTDEYHERLKSDPFTMAFEAVPGGVYRIGAEDPEDLGDARDYEKHFKVWLEEEEIEGVTVEAGILPPEDDMAAEEEEIEEATAEARIAPPEEDTIEGKKPPPAMVPEEKTTVADMQQTSEVSTLDLLKLWWPRTNKEEKQLFLEWIEEKEPLVPDIQTTPEVSALDLMKFWWDRAEDAEKWRFLAWTKEG